MERAERASTVGEPAKPLGGGRPDGGAAADGDLSGRAEPAIAQFVHSQTWKEEADHLRDAHPGEVLAWCVETFPPRVGLTCSFGGTGIVLAHMLSEIAPEVPVYFLNTGFLFPETLASKEQFVQTYGLNVVEVHPRLTVEEQARRYGATLYERDPDRCCHIRKVEPMQRVLQGLDAWITGLRRDQSATRRHVEVVEPHRLSDGRVIAKVNPLAAWTKREAWKYIRQHELPYNPLLDAGYTSIGCRPCTRPIGDGEDERAGRWAGSPKTECGLHTFTGRMER